MLEDDIGKLHEWANGDQLPVTMFLSKDEGIANEALGEQKRSLA